MSDVQVVEWWFERYQLLIETGYQASSLLLDDYNLCQSSASLVGSGSFLPATDIYLEFKYSWYIRVTVTREELMTVAILENEYLIFQIPTIIQRSKC